MCSALAMARRRFRRSMTGQRAMPTGPASCTCANRCPASRCSSRSTCASSGSVQQAIASDPQAVEGQGRHGGRARPRTGGILAMASAPGVPPQGYRAGNPNEWRLRAITDLYEPGSTFKLVTFMAALQEGVIRPARRSSCPTATRRRSTTRTLRTIPDAHPHAVEDWTAREILAHSSNVGTITIAEQRLGQTQPAEVDQGLGFGKLTGVDLPGEQQASVLPDDKWYGTGDPQRPDRREHRRHAAADGGAVRLDRQRRQSGSSRTSRPPSAPSRSRAGAAPARHAARRPRAAQHAHRRRRLRHRHARQDQGIQRRGQDRHDAEVRRQARDLLRPLQGPLRVPDVVRRLRARQASALRRARDGRRAAVRRTSTTSRAATSRRRHSRASPRASCRCCRSSPIVPGSSDNPTSRLQPPWSSPRCARTRASPRV